MGNGEWENRGGGDGRMESPGGCQLEFVADCTPRYTASADPHLPHPYFMLLLPLAAIMDKLIFALREHNKAQVPIHLPRTPPTAPHLLWLIILPLPHVCAQLPRSLMS